MARDKRIRVSESEQEKLDEARDAMFGTSEVPYGKTIEALAEYYIEAES